MLRWQMLWTLSGHEKRAKVPADHRASRVGGAASIEEARESAPRAVEIGAVIPDCRPLSAHAENGLESVV